LSVRAYGAAPEVVQEVEARFRVGTLYNGDEPKVLLEDEPALALRTACRGAALHNLALPQLDHAAPPSGSSI
jgi:hypothetical protein